MIYIGLDDTDTLDTPGTNQLARQLVRELADDFHTRMILRHQLLQDPRVPCTRKNGCASLWLEPRDKRGVSQIAAHLKPKIIAWCPTGSDPGLCIAEDIPDAVIEWGRRCQREFVMQDEARCLAADNGIYLEGFAGTEDGVIGALAAVGLAASRNDGRVVHLASSQEDLLDVSGSLTTDAIHSHGIDEIRDIELGELISSGKVEIVKKLRPNFRGGRIVLYVARRSDDSWEAIRVT